MNQFGGNWTEAKMEIVVAYAKAYLTIMNKQHWVKTLYFDGFAGSGLIDAKEREEMIKGTALRVLDIDEPRPFDMYYFVEMDPQYAVSLKSHIKNDYPTKKAYVKQGDCNEKMIAMAEYLKKHSSFRALAFIDPYGMTVNWSSIEALKDLGIDFWILVPTGMGVNRLLVTDGNISDAWLLKLEKFLGLSREEIKNHFYQNVVQTTVFGDETRFKENNIVHKIGELYTNRLKTVFKFVSESFVMRNKTNSIMYHFMMATNNATALNIANDVIKPKFKL